MAAKPKPKETKALTERLRRICMALPDVTEKVAWGEYTWRAPKIFAMTDTKPDWEMVASLVKTAYDLIRPPAKPVRRRS